MSMSTTRAMEGRKGDDYRGSEEEELEKSENEYERERRERIASNQAYLKPVQQAAHAL